MLCSTAWGQNVHLRTLNRTTGAPSNFFNDILFDKDQRAVFATDDGLFTYNGTAFKSLVKHKIVRHLTQDTSCIYFSCEDSVFQIDAGEHRLLFLHTSAVRDMEIVNEKLFVLGQNDWAVYQQGKPLFSDERDGGHHFVKHENRLYLVKNEGVFAWKSDRFSNAMTAEEPLFFALPKTAKEWVFATENDVFQTATKQFAYSPIVKISNPNAAAYVNGMYCIATKDAVYVINNEKVSSFRQKELQGTISQCYIDVSGGIWLLTQGNGCFYAESTEIVHLPRVENSETKTTLEDLDVLNFTKTDAVRLSPQLDTENSIMYEATEHEGIAVVDIVSGIRNYIDIAKGLSHNYVKSWALKDDTLFVLPKRGEINTIVRGEVVETPKRIKEWSNRAQMIAFDTQEHNLSCYNANGWVAVLGKDGRYTEHKGIASARFFDVHRGKILLVSNDRCQGIDLNTSSKRTLPLPKMLSDVAVDGGYNEQKDSYTIHHGEGRTIIPMQAFAKEFINNVVISSFYVDGKRKDVHQVLTLPYGAYILKADIERIQYSQFDKKPITAVLHLDKKEIRKEVINGTVEFPISIHGNYKIGIKDASAVQSIRISVSAPFWRSVWFWAALVVGIVTLSIWISFLRTRRMKREQMRLQRLVDQKTASLQTRNKDVEQIAYALSHDFKSPLSTITMLTEISNDVTVDATTRKQSLELLQSKCKDLSINMNGLIELVQIGTSNVPEEAIVVLELIEDITASLEQQIEGNQVEIRNDLTRNVEVFGVKAYSYSILHNLIANAIKYADASKTSYVSIFVEDSEKYVTVCIEDNGIGMELNAEMKEQLFRPFKQIDTRSEGVGLGLSLVKRMVDFHGGTIDVNSQKGTGTTFKVSFSKLNSDDE